MTDVSDNWNRLAELTKTWYDKDKVEISYRIAVQNHFHRTGEIPDDYIPPKETKK